MNIIASTSLCLRLRLRLTTALTMSTSRSSSRLPSACTSASPSRTLAPRLPSGALLTTALRSISLSSLFSGLVFVSLHSPTLLLPPLRKLLLSLNLAQVSLRNSFLEQFFLQTLLLDDVGDAELQAGFYRSRRVADAGEAGAGLLC
jgi:hypothetical protein